MKFRMFERILFVFGMVACVCTARAVELTDLVWVGAQGGDYNVPENWDPAVKPAGTNRLVFTNDASIVVSNNDDGKIYGGGIKVLAGDVTIAKADGAPGNTRLVVYCNGSSEVVVDVADGATLTAEIPVLSSFSSATRKVYVKRGGGTYTMKKGGCVNHKAILVEDGVFEAAKYGDTALVLADSNPLLVKSGATLRLLSNGSFNGMVPVEVEAGAVLDMNGMTAEAATVIGAGTVTDSAESKGTLTLTLCGGPYTFSGRFTGVQVQFKRYGGGNVRATTEEEFGFIVGAADTMKDLDGTISWSYDTSLTDPELVNPKNSFLRFAPGIGTFYVANANAHTTLAGYSSHPLFLEDLDGKPVTVLTRIAVAHMPNVRVLGSGGLYIGGYNVTLTGDQVDICGTLGTLGGKDDGTAQTITLGSADEPFDLSDITAIDAAGGMVKFLNLSQNSFAGRIVGGSGISVATPMTVGELSTTNAGTVMTADLTVDSGHYTAVNPSFDFAAANLTLTLNGGEFSRPYVASPHTDAAFSDVPSPDSALIQGTHNGTGTLVLNAGDFYALNNGDYGVRRFELNGGRFHIQYATAYMPVHESTAEAPTVFAIDGGEVVVSRKKFQTHLSQDVFQDTDRLQLRVGEGGATLTDSYSLLGVDSHFRRPTLINRPFVQDPDCSGTDGGLLQRGMWSFLYRYPFTITGGFTGEGGTTIISSNATLAADGSFFGSGDTVLKNHSLELQQRDVDFTFRPHGIGKKLRIEGASLLTTHHYAQPNAVSTVIDNIEFAPGSALFLHDSRTFGAGSSTVKLATAPETLPNGRVNLPVFGTQGIYNCRPMGYSEENGFTNITTVSSSFGEGKIVDVGKSRPEVADGVEGKADMVVSLASACLLKLGQNSSLTIGNGTDTAICHLSSGGITGGEGATLGFGTSPALIVCSTSESGAYCGSYISVPITSAAGLSVVSIPDIGTHGWRGVRLTRANTYSGVTRINSAIVQAEHENCFSTGDVYATGGDKHAGGIRFNKEGAVWNNDFHLSGRGIRATEWSRVGDLGFSMQFTADGEVAGDVELGYVARLSASTNAAVTGVVSGTVSGGKLELAYSEGVIRLTGANTYSNGTDIIRSNLEVARGDSLGSGEVWLVNGTLRFVNDEPVVFTNYLKGVGSIEIAGAPVTFAGHAFDALDVKTLAKGSVLNLTTGYPLTAADVSGSTLKPALVVDGDVTLQGDMTVAALWGSGTVAGGTLTVTDEINPAGAGTIGTIEFAEQPVLDGATFTVDIVNGAVDKLVVPGALSLSALDLVVAQYGTPIQFPATEFLESGESLSGNFASVTLPEYKPANYGIMIGASSVTVDYAKPGLKLIIR